MKLITIASHRGEGKFPCFTAGIEVNLGAECERYLNWFQCEIEGYATYIPCHFVSQGRLLCDYNPTELVVEADETVELILLCYGWAQVKRGEDIGWLPCDILLSKV